MTVNFSSDLVYELKLYTDFTDPNCTRLDAILNYYKASYKRSTSYFYLRTLHKDLKESQIPNIDEYCLPAMKCNVSLQQPIWIFGENNILQYMQENYLIDTIHHKSNSAWETTGIDYVKQHIEPQLELLFLNPFLNIMNLSYMNTESFTGMSNNYIYFKLWWYSVVRIAKSTFKGMREMRKRKQEYLDSKNRFLAGVRVFRERLGDNKYHGGDKPDYCDFYLYGL